MGLDTDVRLGLRRAAHLELTKMRHLRTWPTATMILLASLALTVPLSASARDRIVHATTDPWPGLLLSEAMAAALVSPILASVLASRLVDIEHTGGGWNLTGTTGLTPGRLCRAKLVALTGVLVPVVGLEIAVPVLVAHAMGATWSLDPAPWALYAISLLALDVVACGLHILLAALVDNQVVCIGTGFLGSFIALYGLLMPPWLARLVPWGYWAVITPASQTDDGTGGSAVAWAAPDWPWVLGFLVLAASVFTIVTAQLDRIER